MSRHRLAAACLATCATALAGCGEPDTFRTKRPILRIQLDEYRIRPQNISARPGRIKIVVKNTGRLTHNLVVQVPAADVDEKPEPVEGARVTSMQPGASAPPIKVTLAAGIYRIVCTIANHDDLGQYGELKIEGRAL